MYSMAGKKIYNLNFTHMLTGSVSPRLDTYLICMKNGRKFLSGGQ